MRLSALILILCALTAQTIYAANLYRWVDADGRVHYTDQPPPPTARQAEEKKFGGSYIPVDNMPYATQIAAKKYPVVLYAGSCGDTCTQARDYLTRRGIPFSEKDPAKSEADSTALKKLIGASEVPVLLVGDDSKVKGFEASSWDALLDAASYPKSNPLAPKPKPDNAAKPKDAAQDLPAPADAKR